MNFNLRPREQKLLDTAKEFSKEIVAPKAAGWEAERKVPLDTLRSAASHGLPGLLVPEEKGGVQIQSTIPIGLPGS